MLSLQPPSCPSDWAWSSTLQRITGSWCYCAAREFQVLVVKIRLESLPGTASATPSRFTAAKPCSYPIWSIHPFFAAVPYTCLMCVVSYLFVWFLINWEEMGRIKQHYHFCNCNVHFHLFFLFGGKCIFRPWERENISRYVKWLCGPF